MKKNNAWNIRHLVDELFVPFTQRAILLKIDGFMDALLAKRGGGAAVLALSMNE